MDEDNLTSEEQSKRKKLKALEREAEDFMDNMLVKATDLMLDEEQKNIIEEKIKELFKKNNTPLAYSYLRPFMEGMKLGIKSDQVMVKATLLVVSKMDEKQSQKLKDIKVEMGS